MRKAVAKASGAGRMSRKATGKSALKFLGADVPNWNDKVKHKRTGLPGAEPKIPAKFKGKRVVIRKVGGSLMAAVPVDVVRERPRGGPDPGDYPRRRPRLGLMAAPLTGSGTHTDGVVLCNQIRWTSRSAAARASNVCLTRSHALSWPASPTSSSCARTTTKGGGARARRLRLEAASAQIAPLNPSRRAACRAGRPDPE